MDSVTPSSPSEEHDATSADSFAPKAGAAETAGDSVSHPSGPLSTPQVAEFIATAAASGIIGNLAYDLIKPAVVDLVRRQGFFVRRKQKTRLEAIAREAVVRRCSDVGVPCFDLDRARYYHRRSNGHRHVQIRTSSGETAEIRIPDTLAARDVPGEKVKVTLYTRGRA